MTRLISIQVHVPISLRGYHPPEPPYMCIDDIRPTIPWFEEDNTQDEFDWPAVEEDLKDNMSTIMAQGLSATTSKLGEERACLYASCAFVWLFCMRNFLSVLFSLTIGVRHSMEFHSTFFLCKCIV